MIGVVNSDWDTIAFPKLKILAPIHLFQINYIYVMIAVFLVLILIMGLAFLACKYWNVKKKLAFEVWEVDNANDMELKDVKVYGRFKQTEEL